MPTTRNWFRVENKADDGTAVEIHIVDVIGSWDDDWIARNCGYDMGVTARAFVDALAALPESVKSINLHINSPGGDVQGGVNIANALREQQVSKGRTVETFIDGIAASIASVIAMAGSKVHIADNALMMVHNPWSFAIGNAGEMRKVADILDTMRGQIVATYQWHSKKSADDLIALMDAETWLNADEALEQGLATDKIAGLQAAASIDRRALAAGSLKVPEQYRARVDAFLKPEDKKPTPATQAEVFALCREGKCLDLAEQLLADGATLDQAKARVKQATDAAAAATSRATAITAMCAKSKLPQLAAGYIAGAMTEAQVKEHLTTITAAVDKVEIDTGLHPDKGAKNGTAIDRKSIYAKFNNRG